MRVLVVGASGFVGRALVPRLVEQGHEVEAWSRSAEHRDPRARNERVDLLGAGPLPSAGPWDAAFHLAAHAVPRARFTRELVLENLAMTARVVDHLADHSAGCRTLLASSAHVYRPAPGRRREDDPVGARDNPYGTSKLLSEVWIQSRKDVLDVHVVRGFNQIGPGMPSGLLVPDLLGKIGSGESPLLMHGRDDGKDFLDWRDAMDAYLALLSVEAPSGSVWNLCSGVEVKVSALIREFLRALSIVREIRFADERCETAVGDLSKLTKSTGWSPRRPIQETVAAILEPKLDSTQPQGAP